MINYYVYTKKIVEIKVPHSIYELFVYEDSFDFTNTNIHYGMYQLTKLKEEIDDYDLTEEEKSFIEENYKFCENLFENENVDMLEIRFMDEEF